MTSVTLGVDIGGTKLLAVALDGAGTVLADVRCATPNELEDVRPLIGAIASLVASLEEQLGATSGFAPVALGLGVPGLVDQRGRLRFAPNLPAASGVELGRLVAERLQMTEVVVENDVTCAAVAERALGALRGVSHGIVITLGTGIGGGLVVGGEVDRGALGFAGEVGHMIVDPGGAECFCGRLGCWERYASGSALERFAREARGNGRSMRDGGQGPGDLTGEQISAAAARGDELALDLFDRLAWWLALGLANLIAVLDPQRCVMGGGLIGAGEILLTPTMRSLNDLMMAAETRESPQLLFAEMGERAGAVGAALEARRALAS
ncbi:MAG: ROK family protein [Acidimicrobiales bacterium]